MKFKNRMLSNFKMTQYLKKASPYYLKINLILAVVGSVGNVFQILYYQKFVDFVVYKTPKLLEIAVWFLAYHTFCNAVKIFGYWVTYKFNELEKVKICRYYKELVYSKSVNNKLEYYNSEGYPDTLYNAIYNEGMNLFSFVDSLCRLISSVIVFCSAMYLFGRLHIIFVLGIIFVAIKNCVLANKENKISYKIYMRNLEFDRCDTYIYNLFYKKQFARELKMYPVGSYFIEKFKTEKEMRWKGNKKQELQKDMIKFLKGTIDLLIYVLNIVVLVGLLINHKITVGEFTLVLSNFAMLAGYVERIFIFFPEVSNNAYYINNILKLLNSEERDYPKVQHRGENLTGAAEPAYARCDQVSFSYNGKDEIVRDICMELPSGKKIAIVGENGSGKSTFIKLLLGLYAPCKGRLEYFHPDASVETCNELFSTMLQDYKIFPLSILENISADTDSMDTERLEEAICFAGLEKKINALPNGIHTVLTGEFLKGGVSLSGGEQQRLAVARAYAKEKAILILDEPSANLDPIAENELIDKINRIAEGKTVIMVTHNLAYTKNVDMVYFFENGSIVEFGSPKELVLKKGRYEKMLREQIERMAIKSGVQ